MSEESPTAPAGEQLRASDSAISFELLADELVTEAATAPAGRAARTIFGGRGSRLRQTMIALSAGVRLDEHQNPGEATLLVVRGRVAMGWQGGTRFAAAGDFLVVHDGPHWVTADEVSVFLLTAVPRGV